MATAPPVRLTIAEVLDQLAAQESTEAERVLTADSLRARSACNERYRQIREARAQLHQLTQIQTMRKTRHEQAKSLRGSTSHQLGLARARAVAAEQEADQMAINRRAEAAGAWHASKGADRELIEAEKNHDAAKQSELHAKQLLTEAEQSVATVYTFAVALLTG
jgi:hypothetical protein